MGIETFKEYALSLSPVMMIAPINGNHNTIDSYERAVTEVGTTVWRPNSRGWGIDPNNSGGLIVADAVEQRITTFTLFVATTSFSYDTGAIERIINKDGANLMFDLYRSAANVISFDDDNNVRTVATDITEKSSIAISVVSTATPKLYVDGLFVSNFSGVSTITTQSEDINIGATSVNADHMQSPILTSIMFPSELTAQQIAALQSAWNKVIVGRGRVETPVWQVKRDLTNPLVRLDFSTINGQLRDLSGNDLHFTNNDLTILEEAPVGKAGNSQGSAAIVKGSASSSSVTLDDLDPISVSTWVNIAAPVDVKRIFSKGQYDCYISINGADTRLYLACIRAGGTANWIYTLFPTADNPQNSFHLAITYDRSNAVVDPILYINNVATAWTSSSQETGAFISDAANDFTLLGYPGPSNEMTGDLSDVRIYDKILTPDEVETIYLQGALKPYHYVTKHELTTTLTNLAAGAQIGPYNCITAAHSVGEDSVGRFLQMPSGGNVWRSKFAYGSFYIKIHNVDDTNIGFILSEYGIWSDSNNDGYVFRFVAGSTFRFYRLDLGVRTFLTGTGTCSSDTTYELFISRNSSNSEFYVWIRGGIYSIWTQLFTVVNTVYKISNAMSSTAISGTKLYDIQHYEGFLAPSDIGGLL